MKCLTGGLAFTDMRHARGPMRALKRNFRFSAVTPLVLSFDDLIPHSVPYEFAHGMNAELAHDVRAMSLGSFDADSKYRRGFLAALAFR